VSKVFVSPYHSCPTPQFKGNLHTHTTNSDGPLPPQETVRAYADLGYDFLMLSDHDGVTAFNDLDSRGMTLIHGNEITQNGIHILHVGADGVVAPVRNRQAVINAINRQGGFAIVNHPNWGENFIHCKQAEMETLRDYDGLEIYNGVSERVEGSALATDRWDMLLSKGRRVWGFGNDDCHVPCDFGVVWNMVFAEENSAQALIAAMRQGCFYVSTGVGIDAIRVEDNRLIVESEDTQCFRIVRDHGMVLATVEGQTLEFEAPDIEPLSYVRIECFGFGPRMAWTQPFFTQ